MCLGKLSRYADWAPVILRVVLGLILIVHGYDKFFGSGISGVAAFFTQVGVPMPLASAWITAFVEFFGGLLVILGLLSRYAALFIAIEFAVVLLLKVFQWKVPLVDFKTGVGGYQLDLLIFAVALALLLRGSGVKLSLERLLLNKEL